MKRRTIQQLTADQLRQQLNAVEDRKLAVIAASRQVLRWIDSGCDPSIGSVTKLRDALAAWDQVSR